MTQNQLEEKIYQIYKADVLAIKNLADTATKLQAGGITIPGALTVSGGCTINGDTNINTGGSYFRVKGSEFAQSNIRIGSAWGIPGIYSENSQDLVLGGEKNIYIGSDKSRGMHIDASGNATITGGLTVGDKTFKSLLERLDTLENKTQKLDTSGNINKDISSAGRINGWELGSNSSNDNYRAWLQSNGAGHAKIFWQGDGSIHLSKALLYF